MTTPEKDSTAPTDKDKDQDAYWPSADDIIGPIVEGVLSGLNSKIPTASSIANDVADNVEQPIIDGVNSANKELEKSIENLIKPLTTVPNIPALAGLSTVEEVTAFTSEIAKIADPNTLVSILQLPTHDTPLIVSEDSVTGLLVSLEGFLAELESIVTLAAPLAATEPNTILDLLKETINAHKSFITQIPAPIWDLFKYLPSSAIGPAQIADMITNQANELKKAYPAEPSNSSGIALKMAASDDGFQIIAGTSLILSCVIELLSAIKEIIPATVSAKAEGGVAAGIEGAGGAGVEIINPTAATFGVIILIIKMLKELLTFIEIVIIEEQEDDIKNSIEEQDDDIKNS